MTDFAAPRDRVGIGHALERNENFHRPRSEAMMLRWISLVPE